MNMFLGHIGLEPLVWGVIIIGGILILMIKVAMNAWSAVFWDVAIFVAVFFMHGGTMKGSMAAAVAALIGGLVIPPMLKLISFIKR